MSNNPSADNAELRCIENLLNCYCREIAGPRGLCSFAETGANAGTTLKVRFENSGGAELRVAVTNPSLTNSFECLGRPILERSGGSEIEPRELSWKETASWIIAEIELQNHESANPELMGLIENSLQVTRLLTENRPTPLVASYIESEQALTYGHPFHPSPKSRDGMSQEELLRYSPELGARFQLSWLEVPTKWVMQDSLEGESCTEIVERIAGRKAIAGHSLLPMHPWQAQFVKSYPVIAQALERGEARELGRLGPDWFATASVRTLYSPESDYFVKASLNVRVTNCIRRNSPSELQSSLFVTRLMRQEKASLAQLFPRFEAFDEPAYLTLDERVFSTPIAQSFGVILRDARPLKAHAGELPMVAASLFGNRSEGRRLALRMIAAKDRSAWLASYLEQIVHPTLYLFFERGLMFEPHLQNVVIAFDRSQTHGQGRVFLRDFDNAKLLTPGFESERWAGSNSAIRYELDYPLEKAWPRFAYCLFVNNVAEVIASLADGDRFVEKAYWDILRESIESYLERFASPRSEARLRELLTSDALPAKTNLVTRVFKRPDRDAGFANLPNPLTMTLEPRSSLYGGLSR